jgi:DNA-binding response OmpR family regulator
MPWQQAHAAIGETMAWASPCVDGRVDKILVVDDEGHIADVVAMFLREEGLAVLTAGDGLEALEITREEHPRLVLTDVMMPRMDGVDLCRRLRDDPSTGAPVVLFMSAVMRIDLSGCGAAGLIRKPFDLDDLLDTVRRHLVAA